MANHRNVTFCPNNTREYNIINKRISEKNVHHKMPLRAVIHGNVMRYVTFPETVTKIEYDANKVPQQKIILGFRWKAEKQINAAYCTERADNKDQRCFEFSGNIGCCFA